LDDHHHRTAAERREMEMRATERRRQEQWERDHGLRAQSAPAPDRSQPGSIQPPAPEQPGGVSKIELTKAAGAAAAERLDYALNETAAGDVAPPGAGLVVRGARTAVDLYQQREIAAADAKDALDNAREKAGNVRDDLVDKGRAVGRAAGEEMGGAVRQVYGDSLDPFVEMKLNEAREQEERQERKARVERPPAPER
jgi:hypothetical protein